MCQPLTDAVGDNKDSKELLTYIKEEVNHILQINNRMLSFSNLTQENTYGQIDVNEVLKTVFLRCIHRGQRRN